MIAVDIKLPELFESDMSPIGVLHPSNAAYDLSETPLSTAKLILDVETVETGQMVRMYDTYGPVDVFRISQIKDKYQNGSHEKTVTLEHALATLADTLIVGYQEFGGDGVTTQQVLTQMLALQNVQYWVLGVCEYTDEYQYSVENELLLNAILSVPQPLTTKYRWTFNTNVFPFVLNLVEAEATPTIEMRTSRNIQSVTYMVDRSNMRTRLYPLGYGEGVNQLTIKDVNGGVPYIEKNTGTYGVVEDVFVETTITDPQTLKDTALAYIDAVAEPKVTTLVDALDVFMRTGEPLDAIKLGEVAAVPLEEYGITLAEHVVRVQKRDIYNKPYDIKVTLTNQVRDAVMDAAMLLRKTRVGDLYSQGSTSFVPMHYADNADGSNALVCSFYLDPSEIYINEIRCKFIIEAFRAYSAGAAGGGGTTKTSTASGGHTTTSSSGGAEYISNSGSTGSAKNEYGTKNYTGGIAVPTDTGAGDGNTGGPSSANTEGSAPWTGQGSGNTGSAGTGSTGASSGFTAGNSGNTGSADGSGSHSHSMNNHAHGSGNHTHSGPSHTHPIGTHAHQVESHTHRMSSHTHTIGSHVHAITTHTHSDFDHFHFVTVSITTSDHAHTVTVGNHSHNVTLDDHTHNLVHGIYRGTTAGSVSITVDGTAVPPGVISDNEFDAVPYLAKDSNGKITRGTWHTISFIPDTLTRIVCDIQKKTFIRSISGGNY